MLYAIQGRLERQGPTRVLVETGGVTFDLNVPLSTSESLPATGDAVRLLTHLVIREDEWRLFGFATAEEREAFRALLRVSGVGPMIALGLLSGFAPGELGRTVAQGDVRALTRVKGVGKKTAERIVIELRDVFAEAGSTAASGVATGGDAAVVTDALAALTALGFEAAEARRRVEQAQAKGGADDVGELVRRALRA